MGLIGRILGTGGVKSVGDAVTGVAEVFRPNATRKMEIEGEAHAATLTQFSAEFAAPGDGWFDRFVNGLNRLPRPTLALGTLGLFVFAMIDPLAFADRMQGLGYIPDPLWWLLGAIVSFYFGARELHYRRSDTPPRPPLRRAATSPEVKAVGRDSGAGDNPALAEWRSSRGK